MAARVISVQEYFDPLGDRFARPIAAIAGCFSTCNGGLLAGGS
jgi:hypothetical protein